MATMRVNLPGLSAGERVSILSSDSLFMNVATSDGDTRVVLTGDVDAHDYCEHEHDWCVA